MSKILTEEECQKIHESYSEMTHNPHIALRNILQLLYTISELRKENAELIAKKIDWEKVFDKVLFNYKDRELNTEFYGCYELVKREIQEQLILSNNK